MLIRFLNMLREGKNYSLEEISNTLEISIPTVKAQLEYLEQQGYVEKLNINQECNKSCNGCKGCSNQIKIPSMWKFKK